MVQGAFPIQQSGFMLSSLSLISVRAGRLLFELIKKIFHEILKGFDDMTLKGEFSPSSCRWFVYTGLEVLEGEGMWGEACDPAGVRPSDGLLIPYPLGLYW